MVSNNDLNSIATDFSIFCARSVRVLLWLGSVISLVVALNFFFTGTKFDPDQVQAGNSIFTGSDAGYLSSALIWVCAAINCLVLSVLAQAMIVFFEHARNQFVTASAMELIKTERNNAAPS